MPKKETKRKAPRTETSPLKKDPFSKRFMNLHEKFNKALEKHDPAIKGVETGDVLSHLAKVDSALEDFTNLDIVHSQIINDIHLHLTGGGSVDYNTLQGVGELGRQITKHINILSRFRDGLYEVASSHEAVSDSFIPEKPRPYRKRPLGGKEVNIEDLRKHSNEEYSFSTEDLRSALTDMIHKSKKKK